MKMPALIQNMRHILSVLVLLYPAYCVLLFLFQRQMLFPYRMISIPSTEVMSSPQMEKIWISTSFGKVEAWFLPSVTNDSKKPSPAVIFAHGNGEIIDSDPDEFRKFTHFGMGVLLVEYPGYGRSEGTPSQTRIRETFIRAYDVLVARKEIDASRIVLLGRSLGGGAVCALAAERPSAALILMSTFTSVRSFSSRYFVPGFLVRDPFDNLAVVGSYPGPVLVIHGDHDDLIPYEHGLTLYRTAPHGKMITYSCAHNDCPPRWDIFWQDVKAFLEEAGVLGKDG